MDTNTHPEKSKQKNRFSRWGILKGEKREFSPLSASQGSALAKHPNKSKQNKSKSLIRSSSTVSSMTMISRMMGFVRDMVIAQIFGAAAATDAFYVAFRIPNFLRQLFAEGAFSQAFVPVLSEYVEQKSLEDVRGFISRMSGTLGLVLMIVSILAFIATPLLVLVFAPGYLHDPYRYHLANDMLRVTFPYLFFISLTAFAGAVQNTHGRFVVPAFTPVLLNLSMIAAAFLLTPYFEIPIEGLAYGVLIAGIVQFLFQLPFLWRMRLLALPKVAWQDPGVRRVLRLMLPALFGVSVGQLSLLIDTIFASFLQAGSISWLYYSDRLTNLPLGIFGVAISTVILPHLSKKVTHQAEEDYSKTIDWALRTILVIAIPSVIGFLCLGGPMIVTLFQHGKFGIHDTYMTYRSLFAFALGIPTFMMIKVLASGFYARQNIRTPVKIGVIAMISNMVLNAILIWPLAHAGLALSTSLSSMLNAGLLFFTLRKRGLFLPQSGWLGYLLKLLCANLVMGATIFYLAGPLSQWFVWNGSQRLLHLFPLIMLALVLYFGLLRVMGLKLRHFRGAI